MREKENDLVSFYFLVATNRLYREHVRRFIEWSVEWSLRYLLSAY